MEKHIHHLVQIHNQIVKNVKSQTHPVIFLIPPQQPFLNQDDFVRRLFFLSKHFYSLSSHLQSHNDVLADSILAKTSHVIVLVLFLRQCLFLVDAAVYLVAQHYECVVCAVAADDYFYVDQDVVYDIAAYADYD